MKKRGRKRVVRWRYLGLRLRDLGLPEERVADILGVGVPTLRGWLQGRFFPSQRNLWALGCLLTPELIPDEGRVRRVMSALQKTYPLGEINRKNFSQTFPGYAENQ